MFRRQGANRRESQIQRVTVTSTSVCGVQCQVLRCLEILKFLYSYNKNNYMHSFLKFIFGIKLYMFRTVPASIIRSFSLYTQQWYVSYSFADSLRAGSGRNVN